jgi:glucose-1-phosphate thymidylyltransferase
VLGDNIFFGQGFTGTAAGGGEARTQGATVFGCQVKDPERFGVVAFDERHRAISLEEKPVRPVRQTMPSRDCIFTTTMWLQMAKFG